MATPVERARGGRIAVAAFAARRAEHEPFTIDGFTAVALLAVDAYAKYRQDPPFQDQAERGMADALSTLGETATAVFHYMDGTMKAADLYTRAARIAVTGVWGIGECAPDVISEEINAAALLAALSLTCSALWEDTTEVEMLDETYARYTSEAEDTRFAFARRVRRLVEAEAVRGAAVRQFH